MHHVSDLTGRDKFIYKVKKPHHFTLFELVHLEEDPADYVLAGYIVQENAEFDTYEKLYVKVES